MPGMPGQPGVGGGKRAKGRQAPSKAKNKRVSGNPAKAAQQRAIAAQAAKNKPSGSPFGQPGGEEVDYEKAAAALDLPKDFSKYLK